MAEPRASDADRERVATRLRERFGEGRLDDGELDLRTERADGARAVTESVFRGGR